MRLLSMLLLAVCCGALVAAEAPASTAKKAPPRKKRGLPQWEFVPRAEFEANFAEFAKRLRKQGPERVAPEMKVEKEERFPGYIRRLVSYRVGENERITGWLLVPDDLKPGEKRPLMLTLHGTNVYGKDAAINCYDAYPAGDAKEQAVRFDVDFGTRSDRWIYPEFLPVNGFAPGLIGFSFEIKTPPKMKPTPTNLVMLLEERKKETGKSVRISYIPSYSSKTDFRSLIYWGERIFEGENKGMM